MIQLLPSDFDCHPDIKCEILNKLEKIRQTEDEIPGVIIVHDIRSGKLIYMSKRGLEGINTTLLALRNMPTEQYYQKYFNPEDAEDYVPKIMGLMEKNDKDELLSYFQQVRISPDNDWIWHASSTKIFAKDEEGKPMLTITVALAIDPKSHLTAKVERLMQENNFLKKHQQTYASLSKREIEVLRLIAKGATTADLAKALFISKQTANTHRRNIKKKLHIKSSYDHASFAHAFNLI